MHVVHWTLNRQEAEIVTGRLHVEGIPAWVLNKDQISINWWHILALGGFRVYVPRAAAAQADVVMTRWQRGELSLDDALDEVPCPRCGSRHYHTDFLPRGLVIAFWLVFAMPLLWPTRRIRCDQCGHRRQYAPIPYATLAAAAADADDQAPPTNGAAEHERIEL